MTTGDEGHLREWDAECDAENLGEMMGTWRCSYDDCEYGAGYVWDDDDDDDIERGNSGQGDGHTTTNTVSI